MRLLSSARDALVQTASTDAAAKTGNTVTDWFASVPQSWRLGIAIFFGVIVVWAIVRKAVGATLIGLVGAGAAALWYLYAAL